MESFTFKILEIKFSFVSYAIIQRKVCNKKNKNQIIHLEWKQELSSKLSCTFCPHIYIVHAFINIFFLKVKGMIYRNNSQKNNKL